MRQMAQLRALLTAARRLGAYDAETADTTAMPNSLTVVILGILARHGTATVPVRSNCKSFRSWSKALFDANLGKRGCFSDAPIVGILNDNIAVYRFTDAVHTPLVLLPNGACACDMLPLSRHSLSLSLAIPSPLPRPHSLSSAPLPPLPLLPLASES